MSGHSLYILYNRSCSSSDRSVSCCSDRYSSHSTHHRHTRAFKKSVFCHRSFVREQRCYPVIHQLLCNRWCTISVIHDHGLNADIFQFVIYTSECTAVIQVSWINIISKDPSVLVTGCLYTVRENTFVFSFMEPAAFRIDIAGLYLFPVT